jgi:hypothetical protein
MKNQVFLGGTVGLNNWRKALVIPELLRWGVKEEQIFDPVVEDWNAEAQAKEDAAKAESRFMLFYISNPYTPGNEVSAYSLVEAVMGLYDEPDRTVVVFNLEGLSISTGKSMKKIIKDLKTRFPDSYIFDGVYTAISFLSTKLKEQQNGL